MRINRNKEGIKTREELILYRETDDKVISCKRHRRTDGFIYL